LRENFDAKLKWRQIIGSVRAVQRMSSLSRKTSQSSMQSTASEASGGWRGGDEGDHAQQASSHPGSNEHVNVLPPEEDGDTSEVLAGKPSHHSQEWEDNAKSADRKQGNPALVPAEAPSEAHALKHEQAEEAPPAVQDMAKKDDVPTPIEVTDKRERKHKQEEEDYLNIPGTFDHRGDGEDGSGEGLWSKLAKHLRL
jgi:hypothetical protein